LTSHSEPGQLPTGPERIVTPVNVPPVAWLVPAAALLGLVGAFAPWFRARGVYEGHVVLEGSSLNAFTDATIGVLAPIVLIVGAVIVVLLFRGTAPRWFLGRRDPVRSVAEFVIGAGAVAVLCLVIAWFLVPAQYHFSVSGARYDWAEVERIGIDLSRGPQFGFVLTGAAVALAMVSGALMMVMAHPVAVISPAR
jgi:NADH:ubiquinone oxidoreductase subunit 6 (subunit J)